MNSDSYISPFTQKYGSDQMRDIWSEFYKRLLWRNVWTALAQAQYKVGLVSYNEYADIKDHEQQIDIGRSLLIEKQTKHDLMAELRCFAEQCPYGGGKIHLGATSADIEENADALRIRTSLSLIHYKLNDLFSIHWHQIKEDDKPSFLEDLQDLGQLSGIIRGKGIKGAVGTSASYTQLLEGTGYSARYLEAEVMRSIDIQAFEVSTQTATRKQDLRVAIILSRLALTLQSALFKLDVDPCTNMLSTIRYCMGVFWDNAAHSLLERTLDDSANRREVLPVIFLSVDEMLTRLQEAL